MHPYSITKMAVACIAIWCGASFATGWLGVWAAIGPTAMLLGLVVFRVYPDTVRAWIRPSGSGIVVGVVAGALMAVATHLSYPLMAHAFPQVSTQTAQLYIAFRALPMWVTCLCIGPVIVAEELIWRGIVQDAISERYPAVAALVFAAIFYGAVQLPMGSPVLALVAVACGAAWGTLRLLTGSLLPVIIAHLIWDFCVLLWWPLDTL